MTPAAWNAALASTIAWQDAYAVVAREARAFLAMSWDPDATFTTTELVEALYNEQHARGDGILARKRIYKALAGLALHDLADCATKGEQRMLRHTKKIIRPWLWHAPREIPAAPVATCPHCGGIL